MNRMGKCFLYLFIGLFIPLCAMAQKKGSYTLNLSVKDKDTKEAVIMATIQLRPTGAMAVTDMDGRASVKNVEAGTYTVNISYVGYEPISTPFTATPSGDGTAQGQMPTSKGIYIVHGKKYVR